MNSEEQSLSRLEKFEMFLDRCVRCGEVLIVVLLIIAIVLAIIAEAIWILWSGGRQERFAQALKTLNDNWKIGLIILIPLFFRAIRAFLYRMEKFGSMEAPHKKTPDPARPQGE